TGTAAPLLAQAPPPPDRPPRAGWLHVEDVQQRRRASLPSRRRPSLPRPPHPPYLRHQGPQGVRPAGRTSVARSHPGRRHPDLCRAGPDQGRRGREEDRMSIPRGRIQSRKPTPPEEQEKDTPRHRILSPEERREKLLGEQLVGMMRSVYGRLEHVHAIVEFYA